MSNQWAEPLKGALVIGDWPGSPSAPLIMNPTDCIPSQLNQTSSVIPSPAVSTHETEHSKSPPSSGMGSGSPWDAIPSPIRACRKGIEL